MCLLCTRCTYPKVRQGHFSTGAEARHDDLRVKAFFHERLHLLEQLPCQQHHRGGAVPHFRVLMIAKMKEKRKRTINFCDDLILSIAFSLPVIFEVGPTYQIHDSHALEETHQLL
jgi:hypothetical protein